MAPWYPKGPTENANRELKQRTDLQYWLKRKLYPRQMRYAELPLKSQIPEDPGQQYAEHESLVERQARLEQEFASTQHTSGFQKLMESQPEDLWQPTPGPTMQDIREDAKQAGWWDAPGKPQEIDPETGQPIDKAAILDGFLHDALKDLQAKQGTIDPATGEPYDTTASANGVIGLLKEIGGEQFLSPELGGQPKVLDPMQDPVDTLNQQNGLWRPDEPEY